MKRWEHKPSAWEQNIEKQLQALYQPVLPSAEFVQNLKHRLNQSPLIEIRQSRSQLLSKKNVLWIGAGMLGGVLMMVNGIRAVLSILAALGLLRQFKKQIEESESFDLPLRPA